jgi:hypothetical protein
MRTYAKSLIALGAFLTVADEARAQPLIAHAESIECTVANADLVFIATLVEFGNAHRADGRDVHDATITIEQTLKTDILEDEPYQRLQVQVAHPVTVLTDWKQRSCRLLVAYDECAPYSTTVIELVPGKMEVLKADFTLLRDSAEVIRAAEEALRRMPAAVKRIHTFRLIVPRERVAETAWDKYYDTGYLVLTVPVDEELQNRALEYIRSESYMSRYEGVRALRYFKSDENLARVKALLNDPGWAYLRHAEENDGIEVRIYGVRQEAYRTLKCWEIDVQEPLIREEVRK